MMVHDKNPKDAGKTPTDSEMTGNETGETCVTDESQVQHNEEMGSINEEKCSGSSAGTVSGKHRNTLQRASSESVLLDHTYPSRFFQYREDESLTSDEESSESMRSIRSLKSTPGRTFCSLERVNKCSKFRKYLRSIPDINDCPEKPSNLFAVKESPDCKNNKQNQEECDDILLQLEKSLVVDAGTSNKHENALLAPEQNNLPYPNFCIKTPEPSAGEIRKYLEHYTYPMISSPISSKYINMENSELLQSSSNSSVFYTPDNYLPDIVSSKTSLNRSVDTAMISSPTSSKCINMENSQSAKCCSNLNTFHTRDIHMPDLISLPTSNNGSPKRSLYAETDLNNLPNYSISPGKKVLRSWELPGTSTQNANSENEYHHSMEHISTCTSSRDRDSFSSDSSNMLQTSSRCNSLQSRQIHSQKPNPVRRLNFGDTKQSNDDKKGDFFKTPRNRKEILDSPNFGIALKMFSRSCEFPVTSSMNSSNASKSSLSNSSNTITIKTKQKSYNDSSLKSGNKTKSSLSDDTPSTVEKPLKSHSNPQLPKPKAARKLNFEEMSPSNDARIAFSKEQFMSSLSDLPNMPPKLSRFQSSDMLENEKPKQKSGRKLDFNDTEIGYSLAGTHTTQFQFIQSSDCNSTIPEMIGKISGNAHCSISSSVKSNENISKYKETESTSSVLRSLEIINSENIETHHVPQKRSFPTDETLDFDVSHAEKRTHKKSKQDTSPEIINYKNNETRHESRKRSMSNREVSDEESKKNKKFKQRSSNDKF